MGQENRPMIPPMINLATIASCIAVLCTLTLTAPAKEFIGNIIKTVTTGHNEFSVINPNKLPELYVGMLFDKDSNPVTDFYPNSTEYYDKDGKKIEDVYLFLQEEYKKIADANGWDIKISESDEDKAVILDDLSVAWECDGISVEILGRNILSRSELLSVANSVK